MAFIKERFLTASQAVEKALEEMGDVEARCVIIIDDMDEITGNMKTAELREFFAPDPLRDAETGELENNVMLLTSNLGQDPDEMKKLVGSPPGYIGHENQPDTALHKRFENVTFAPLTPEIMKALAKRMIGESALSPMQQEGLCAIIHEDVIGKKKVNAGMGARGLRHIINDYLRTPLTPEWEQTLLSRSPTANVINSLSKGTTRKIAAPRPARFRRTLP